MQARPTLIRCGAPLRRSRSASTTRRAISGGKTRRRAFATYSAYVNRSRATGRPMFSFDHDTANAPDETGERSTYNPGLPIALMPVRCLLALRRELKSVLSSSTTALSQGGVDETNSIASAPAPADRLVRRSSRVDATGEPATALRRSSNY